MTILKCKMCGGDLNFEEGATVVECEYCGTKQTVPTIDDEKKITLFARANRLRFACEFDKASNIYESIVADFPEEAEAYWGLVLCKYGIEYVDDPATGRKIPTCHRSSFESVMEDDNFEQVMENADPIARSVYREEAKQIEGLRRGIIEVSNKEEPYDIFICYKETAENGERTIDSVIAQDVYNELTEKGYHVFFSRITLEDKLGQEYEPYIFAALNSAKIMLAFGTDYEYYNAVWVKNEWSRFLQLIARGEKKTLIPCYKNIDAYDMPKEFARLQAQDMGKVGAMQDLQRGIEKLLPKKESEQAGNGTVTVHQQAQSATIDSLLKRAMYLEDKKRLLAEKRRNVATGAKVVINKDFIFAAKKNESLKIETTYYRGDYPWKSLNIVAIAVGNSHSVGLKSDRTVTATGSNDDGQCNVSDWKDIVAIAAGNFHTVGLKSDGTVIATGSNDGRCNVSDWKDIVAIAARGIRTVGLKSDGTVVATSNDNGQYNVSDWRDIVDIAVGNHNVIDYIIGLKSDGTVVAAGNNDCRQCNVSDWNDIIAIAVGSSYTVGLKSDGTVVATGGKRDRGIPQKYQLDVSGWSDIIAIAVGNHVNTDYIVGLKSNGTVITKGYYYSDENQNISNWRDIIAIAAGANVVGLKSDGTILATAQQHYVDLEIRRVQREQRERRNSNLCQYCGGGFKGVLIKKCSVCGNPKDY